MLSFSRNFGHQTAITAGMDRAEGDAVVVMDADLQDPPEVVSEMLAQWREGFDVVYGERRKRDGETVVQAAHGGVFYRLLRAMISPIDPARRRRLPPDEPRVVLAMRALREQHRFVRGLVAWVGFRQTAVNYDRPARFAGETKYPLRKMLRFAIDGITSFSVVPLRLATYLGVLVGLSRWAASAWAIYGSSSAASCPAGRRIMIWSLLGSSAQLLMTGILGEYVGRIYEEVKRRPLYIVTREENLASREPRARRACAATARATPAQNVKPA